MAEFGPVQILVVGFADERFAGQVLPELRRLRERGAVRLLDLLFVSKDEDGNVTTMDVPDLSKDELTELGAIAGALVGFGPRGEADVPVAKRSEIGELAGVARSRRSQTWVVTDAIPPGTSAAVALIEHRWAIPLRGAIAGAGGFALADSWVHPADLMASGAAVSRL